jgi:hypothetical protein
VIHREPAGLGGGEAGGGSSGRGVGSQQLHLVGCYWEAASTIGPHHTQEIL